MKSGLKRQEEKKKKFGPSTKSKRHFTWSSGPQTEQKGDVDKASFPMQRGFLAGKPAVLHNMSRVCFRCLTPGHFARDCWSTNTRTVTFNGVQPRGPSLQPNTQEWERDNFVNSRN